MKNLLEYLVIHLVSDPEDVRVEEHEDDRGMVYTLHVHPEDMGRVIGKGGSVIQAIRTIAKIRAVKEGIRAYITLADQGDKPAQPAAAASETAPLDEAAAFTEPASGSEDGTNEELAA